MQIVLQASLQLKWRKRKLMELIAAMGSSSQEEDEENMRVFLWERSKVQFLQLFVI